ncbi:DEAD/DEAH box helicase [soil metagenome]
MLFADLQLHPTILEAIKSEGYTIATPIQAQAIPYVLAGKDVLGCAQTGTGKTAAFAMPILHRLAAKPVAAADAPAPAFTPPPTSHEGHGSRHARGFTGHKPRVLVLCPTRELASQIADSFRAYGRGLNLKHVTIFGGVGQHPQVEALRRGVDIIIATPGRLMDLMEQRHVDLSAIEMLVLDEADRMLDMGFIQPIRRICGKLPANRQTLLFSATMAPEIRKLADSLLRQPSVVNIAPVAKTSAQIEESIYKVEKRDKPDLLAYLVQHLPMYRSLVFTKTKHGADRVVRHLHARGIKAEAIHGNKSQNVRQRALANFANNKIPVLVATDVASRGIDVDGITHVVNYDLTHEPETYVHRIGRTGRAGATGQAVSFCDREENANLRAIERLIRRTIPVMVNPLPASDPNAAPAHREQEDRPRRGDNSERAQSYRSDNRGDSRGDNRGFSGGQRNEGRNDFRPERAAHSDRPDSRGGDRNAPRTPAIGDVGGVPLRRAQGPSGTLHTGRPGRPAHPSNSKPASGKHPIGRGAAPAGAPARHPLSPVMKQPKISSHRKGQRRPQEAGPR